MQFYILHEDPRISSSLLPDYALFKVNLREGWQILSDIGHIYGVTWEGQNRCYSKSHALTRLLSSDEESFFEFLDHYESNLVEYFNRKGNFSPYDEKYYSAFAKIYSIFDKLPSSKYESTIDYLLREKVDKLTELEVERLKRNISQSNDKGSH